ncbi:MAG: putative quinol monooxygenase [Parvularculaceae bacterium]
MIIVAGRVALRPGALPALMPAMKAMVAASRAEPGCIAYHYGPDMTDPDAFLVLERWETRAALDAHFETPHLKAWRAALRNVGLVSRDLIAVEEAQADIV